MKLTRKSTDHQLKTAVTDELDWAPSVDPDHIGVSVIDGAVTLAGQVRSYPENSAAAKAAFRVRGVTAVADELVVEHAWGQRSDADIARDAGAAVDAVGRLPGVTGIENAIRLTLPVSVLGADATTRITDALVRNAQVEGENVHVAVNRSEIHLSDTVHSWAEFRQASHAVWVTPGVTEVRNHLCVVS